MNDSLRTDVFVRFQPESIACACIYLAARTLEVSAAPPPAPGLALSPAPRTPPECSRAVLVGAGQQPLGDPQACLQGNEGLAGHGDEPDVGVCVHRFLCPTVPTGFFCLGQVRTKFKRSA